MVVIDKNFEGNSIVDIVLDALGEIGDADLPTNQQGLSDGTYHIKIKFKPKE